MIPRLMLAGLVAASEQAISAGMRAADIQPEQLAPMVGKVLKLRVPSHLRPRGSRCSASPARGGHPAAPARCRPGRRPG